MIGNERQYKGYKKVSYECNIVSQCMLFKTVSKLNLSVFSNILRQINSKIGGDLYNINFSKEILPKTMLIGIDVCHQG